MASLLGEEPGETVGYAMRMESRMSARTRIMVVTEGVLARMILDDPELPGVSAVIFDEFHERSLDGDFGLALALSEFGHYPWSEFQQSLIDTIGAWEQAPGDTRGEWEYYDHWVAALESVVDEHGILHLPVAVDDGGHAAAEHDH